ncbi:MAG: protein kinase domain-containing protein [Gammaproteobacteria bacterium]
MTISKRKMPRIVSFDLQAGTVLAQKYKVVDRLGAGWEGEVYLIRERATGIERTAKLFFPQRNLNDRAARFYARKLHKLRQCQIIIQYHTRETIVYRGVPVSVLISEFVAGELLSEFLARQPGQRLGPFQATHLLHALASGIECIHAIGEYHGDLHTDNIIVQRCGLGFELKLLDMFYWGAPRAENIYDDVVHLIRIFFDALGGQKHYARQPPEVKAICRGLKRSLLIKKFRTARELRTYLETMQWS